MSDSTPDSRNQMVLAWNIHRENTNYQVRWVRGSRELHLYERRPGNELMYVQQLPVILVPGATQEDVYHEAKRYERSGW